MPRPTFQLKLQMRVYRRFRVHRLSVEFRKIKINVEILGGPKTEPVLKVLYEEANWCFEFHNN